MVREMLGRCNIHFFFLTEKDFIPPLTSTSTATVMNANNFCIQFLKSKTSDFWVNEMTFHL